MAPDLKFFGFEGKVHVKGKVEAEPTSHGLTGRVLYVASQEDADVLTPFVGKEILEIDTRNDNLDGKKGGRNFFMPPVRLDKVEVKK